MKRGRKKLTHKRKKQLIKQANAEKRRYFVNPTCIKCKTKYHIRVNDKSEWDKVKDKYICQICKPRKRR